jgi:hypothetical protein
MALITKLPTIVTNNFRQDPRLHLIYGPPKIGKTSILAGLKGNFIIDTEQGTGFVSALKQEVDNIQEFNQVCSLIINTGKPYKFVTIDTIDKLEEWAEVDATNEYKKSIQGKNFSGSSVLNLPNGGGYLWLRQSFLKLIAKAALLAPNVILVGHIRDKMIESGGKEVSAKDLDLTGKIKSIVCSKADAIGYLSRTKDGNLQITYQTREDVVCGSRCQHLKGATFVMDSPDPAMFNWAQIYIDYFSDKKEPISTEPKSQSMLEKVEIV